MEERIINVGGSGGNKPNPHKHSGGGISRLTVILLAVCAVAVCVVVIVCVFAFIPSNKNVLVGTWEYNDSIHYTFEENGKGHIADSGYEYKCSYKYDKSEIKLDFEDDFIVDCVYKYSISGDELTLIGSTGTDGGTYTLKRAEH